MLFLLVKVKVVWTYGFRALVSSFFEKIKNIFYKFKKIKIKILDVDNNKISLELIGAREPFVVSIKETYFFKKLNKSKNAICDFRKGDFTSGNSL
jgi:predicted hydrocarbon binding protein